jgi:hypothetical protein
MLVSRRISAVSFGPSQAAGASSAVPIIGNSPTFAEAQSAAKEYKLKLLLFPVLVLGERRKSFAQITKVTKTALSIETAYAGTTSR